jgi:hypothetical protein
MSQHCQTLHKSHRCRHHPVGCPVNVVVENELEDYSDADEARIHLQFLVVDTLTAISHVPL